MNIFEDLLDELREENLIENTAAEIKVQREKSITAAPAESATAETVTANVQEISLPNVAPPTAPVIQPTAEKPAEKPSSNDKDQNSGERQSAAKPSNVNALSKSPGTDFYRRKANEEVAFLQIVEAAFAGIERDQMKVLPQSFNDLEVKRALHTFIQTEPDAPDNAYKKSEFNLLRATEGWHSTLAARDRKMLPANLRRYCESSRPPLSAPALLALARFYRNSAYSGTVRSKYDLLMTRIFSKDAINNRREMFFERSETIERLGELYADWSSVPLYATEPDDAGIASTVRGFEDFIEESANFEHFDQFIKTNFFNRLRLFKESTSEDFYAPPIAAVGVEANISIGNRYVELLEKEKHSGNVESVGNKYGMGYDHTVSEMTGKTMTLVELLTAKIEAPRPVEQPFAPVEIAEQTAPDIAEKAAPEVVVVKQSSGSFGWLAAGLMLILLVGFGIYTATRTSSPVNRELAGAPKIDLENSLLKQYLTDARAQGGVMTGIAVATWSDLNEDQKKYALRLMLDLGIENGYKQVKVVSTDGKTVGTAANGEVVVVE